ncbi:MAG: LysM peptidoglycan-binding domain-containing protein [Ilumatobacteraceae bacterium]
MRRALLISLLILASTSIVACATEEGNALDTLPPIRTTTTSSTTTTSVDDRRRFYEVKSGDNLALIAASFGVPASEIVKLNDLPGGGQLLQIGQMLEIPQDVVLVEELPTPPETTLGP